MDKQILKIRKSLLIFIPFILLFMFTACIEVVEVTVKEKIGGSFDLVEEALVCIVEKETEDSVATDVCDPIEYPEHQESKTGTLYSGAFGKATFSGEKSTEYWLTVKKEGYETATSDFVTDSLGSISVEEVITKMGCIDADGDGFFALTEDCPEGLDCDDADLAINPAAEEICDDGIDNNCDGEEEECVSEACEDIDGDGYFGLAEDCPEGLDCDDANPERNPGAEEICNEIDDDCDIETDELCFDDDGDGIMGDGDDSGFVGDNPCETEETENCDDNCPLVENPDQIDVDEDGKGIACDDVIEFSPEVTKPIQDLVYEAATKCPTECTIKLIKDPDTGADTFNITYSIYIENIDEKTITLTSEEGVTILNTREDTASYRMIDIDLFNGCDNTVNVDGLTIDGNGPLYNNSKGISISAGNRNNIFIKNNKIKNNYSTGASGGGIYANFDKSDSNVYIINNTISNNVIDSDGVYYYVSGGGIYAGGNGPWSKGNSKIYVVNNMIYSNTASSPSGAYGGGMFINGGGGLIVNNTFHANTATRGGGGGGGGGLYIQNDDTERIVSAVNNLFTENNYGLHLKTEPGVFNEIYNNGFKGNLDDRDYCTSVLSCYPASGPDGMDSISEGDMIFGNKECSPHYIYPAIGDLHLGAYFGEDQCIDEGYTGIWDELPEEIQEIDIDGDDRIINTVVDLGADEFVYPVMSGAADSGSVANGFLHTKVKMAPVTLEKMEPLQ